MTTANYFQQEHTCTKHSLMRLLWWSAVVTAVLAFEVCPSSTVRRGLTKGHFAIHLRIIVATPYRTTRRLNALF